MDFKKIDLAFKEYVNAYDMKNEKIEYKYYHTLQVADISYRIARDMGLCEEDCNLAKLIGYLHDIGRFEQVTKTNSFNDTIMDHADNGVRILFEDGIIRRFIEDSYYDDIIRKAIRNHNKYEIEDDVDEREELFAKIIRDSDKIDIFRVRKQNLKDEFIEVPSKEVLNSIEHEQSVRLKDIKNKSDSILCVLAFIFDFNYKVSLDLLKHTGYYEDLINNIEISEENLELFNKIKNIVLKKLEV